MRLINVFAIMITFIKIHWQDRLDANSAEGLLQGIYTIIDATECIIQRPSDPDLQRYMFSSKKKRHGLKYEIAVRISDGRIVWIKGPCAARIHDLAFHYQCGLQQHLQVGENMLGDKGYQGASHIVVPWKKPRGQELNAMQVAFNRLVGSARIIVEHAIGRIKNFLCLRTPWRHALHLHPIAFSVCAQIAQIGMYSHPLHNKPSQFI
jgi:hypothetical protein